MRSWLVTFTLVAAELTVSGVAAAQCPTWSTAFHSNGVEGSVFAMTVFDDGSGPALFAGGSFSLAGTIKAKSVVKWDGASWSALGSGLSSRVRALVVYDDVSGAALYVGGEFAQAGGLPSSLIASWSDACACSGTSYCTSGTTSNGCVPTISGSGRASATASSGFTISASGVEGQKQGHIFYGLNGPNGASWGASSHFLCVKAPSQRTGTQDSGGTSGACDGVIAIDWNTYCATHPNSLGVPFSAGTSVWAQLYFRDPAGPKTTALSNGLSFVVCP